MSRFKSIHRKRSILGTVLNSHHTWQRGADAAESNYLKCEENCLKCEEEKIFDVWKNYRKCEKNYVTCAKKNYVKYEKNYLTCEKIIWSEAFKFG